MNTLLYILHPFESFITYIHTLTLIYFSLLSVLTDRVSFCFAQGVDGFIGGGCNDVCKIVAKVAGAFNMPMVSHR